MYSVMHAIYRASEDHTVLLKEAIPNLKERQTQFQVAHLVVQPFPFHQLRVVEYADVYVLPSARVHVLRTLVAAMDAAASTS